MQLYFDTCVCISLSLSYFLKQWNLLIIKVSLSFFYYIYFWVVCDSVINFQLHTAPPPPIRGHYRLETRCHTPPISLTTCQHSPTLTPTSGHWLVHVMLYLHVYILPLLCKGRELWKLLMIIVWGDMVWEVGWSCF